MAGRSRPRRSSPGPEPESTSAAEAAPQLVRVGRVTGTHGLKGAIRVRPDNPDSEALSPGMPVVFEGRGDPPREYVVKSVARAGAAALRIELDGIDSIDSAEALRGGVLSVRASQLSPPEPGEFYYYQVVGCEVFTTAGVRIGSVTEVFGTGANDVWVVRDGEREVLVPVIEDVVKAIDLGARRMTIEPVPGLLD